MSSICARLHSQNRSRVSCARSNVRTLGAGIWPSSSGAGQIGLLTAATVLRLGTARFFVSELSEARRKLAATLGAVPIDPARDDVVELELELR
jgi:hypothetical protein